MLIHVDVLPLQYVSLVTGLSNGVVTAMQAFMSTAC